MAGSGRDRIGRESRHFYVKALYVQGDRGTGNAMLRGLLQLFRIHILRGERLKKKNIEVLHS